MYRGGIADQTRTSYAIVGINPSADFWIGRPFPSPVTKNGVFGDDCWVVDSNHILRIGILGTAHLWEVADPKV